MTEEQRFYWYVTYSFSGPDGFGNGAVGLHTSKNSLPIRAAGNLIKDKNPKWSTVVIGSWVPITKEEYEEFTA